MVRQSEVVAEPDLTISSLQQLGNTLRQAREARAINVEEVAARLRLGSRVVRDMEAGEFQHLPAATYARGYLRAYANFVGLRAEPLLAAYEQYADQPPEINPFASAPQPQVRATDLPMRAVTFAIVAAILGSAGAWLWQTQKMSTIESLSVPKWGAENTNNAPVVETVAPISSQPVRSAEVVPATPPSVASSSAVPVTPSAATTPVATTEAAIGAPAAGSTAETSNATANPAPAEPTVATSATGSSEAVTPAANSPAATVDATVAATGMQAVPAQGEIPYAAPPSTNADSASTSPPNTTATGVHVLTFECAEDSWLEVFDSENTRLYYNIARQGSRVSVQGLLPYHVKVGNSPAVMVSYEGHPLDMTAFPKARSRVFRSRQMVISPNRESKLIFF